MDWTDQGILLSARAHGENALILHCLTRDHGRHGGLVRGAHSKRTRGLYEPGALLDLRWQARLEEHLGHYACESLRAFGAELLDDPLRLAAVSAAAALLDTTLPERQPHPDLFALTLELLERIAAAAPGWAGDYVRWEIALLAEMGYGLDLGACAATGVTEDLIYVSPKSGRAVSAGAGAPYRGKLLALPGFLSGAAPLDREALAQGLALSGFFLERHVLGPHHRHLPEARTRLIERLTR